MSALATWEVFPGSWFSLSFDEGALGKEQTSEDDFTEVSVR